MHQTTVVLLVQVGVNPPEPFETKTIRLMRFLDAEEL
jgi:hypothetical protein